MAATKTRKAPLKKAATKVKTAAKKVVKSTKNALGMKTQSR